MMATVDLTKDNFQDIVDNNEIVLVELYSPMCGHCRQFTPVFVKVSEDHPGVVFGMVNTETERELAKEFNVVGVPMVIGFCNNEQVASNVGGLSKDDLEEFIEKVRGSSQ